MASHEPDHALSRVEQGAMAPNGSVYIGSQNFYNQPPLHQSGTSSRDRMTNLIAALDFDQRDLRQHSISSTMAQSCEWLNNSAAYRAWVQSYEDKKRLLTRHGVVSTRRRRRYPQGNQLLWIRGKPGVGKSTLMKFALLQARKRAQESNTGDHVFAHFFHARGVELERSIEGLYRTFLAQLLEASSPDLIEKLPPSLVSLIMRKRWDVAILKELLDAVLDQRSPSPIIWFVDALDECDVDMVAKMMDHFTLLLRNVESQGQGQLVHLCMASRHYPDFSINYPHLSIVVEDQQGHLDNIATFIDSHLSIGNSWLAQDILEKVKVRADGVFIWAALVVDVLRTRYSQTAMLRGLVRVLDEIPADLSKLFHEILTKDLLAKETNAGFMLRWRQTILCLQLVLYRQFDLDPKALCWALTSIGESDLATIEEKYSQIVEGGIERYITVISRGLVESIKGFYVQFIHQSVHDFLGGEEGSRALVAMEGLSYTSLASYELFCHGKLRDLYANELLVTFRHTDFARHARLARLQEERHHRMNLRWHYLFLAHATDNILWHANKKQRLGSDQQKFLQGLDLQRWLEIRESVNSFYGFGESSRSPRSGHIVWADLLLQRGELPNLLEDCQLPGLVAARQSPFFGLESLIIKYPSPLAAGIPAPVIQAHRGRVFNTCIAEPVVRVHLRRQQELRPRWYPMFKRLSDKLKWVVFAKGNAMEDFGNPILDVGSVDPDSGVCPATFFLLIWLPLESLHAPDPTQLEKVAHEGLVPTVQYLVDELGVPLHDLPFTTSELLLRSCANHKVDDSRWLLENGASIHARSPQQLTPLHMICHSAAERTTKWTEWGGLLRLLHDAGIDLNTVDDTPPTLSRLALSRLNSALEILRMHKASSRSTAHPTPRTEP